MWSPAFFHTNFSFAMCPNVTTTATDPSPTSIYTAKSEGMVVHSFAFVAYVFHYSAQVSCFIEGASVTSSAQI